MYIFTSSYSQNLHQKMKLQEKPIYYAYKECGVGKLEFCPKCEGLLMPKKQKSKTVFYCPHCGFEQKPKKKPKRPPQKPVPDATITKKSVKIEPSSPTDIQQKGDLEKSLMDLKIKKANISKMSLEFDMKELTGEITANELENKKNKLREIEKNINSQIHELEELLKKFD